MKYGYSLLLAEIVDAAELDYEDTKAFQITCPVCHEPVFKRVRQAEASVTHFLSHYQARDEHDLCELRVNSFSRQVIEQANAVSRGQFLSEFVSVLPEEAIRTLFDQHPHLVTEYPSRQALADRVLRAAELPPLRLMTAETLTDLADHMEQRLQLFEEPELKVLLDRQSPFWIERHRRIMADVARYVVTPAARPAARLLLATTVVALAGKRYYLPANTTGRAVAIALYELLHRKGNDAMKTYKTLMDLKWPAREGQPEVNLRKVLRDALTRSFLGLIADLPYLEILQRRADREKLKTMGVEVP